MAMTTQVPPASAAQSAAAAAIARKKEEKAATEILTISIKGAVYKLAINNIPVGEKRAVRHATGDPFEAYWKSEDKVGEDSVVVLVWLARRAAGEPDLSFDEVEANWPTGLRGDDFSIVSTTADPGDDHPEA